MLHTFSGGRVAWQCSGYFSLLGSLLPVPWNHAALGPASDSLRLADPVIALLSCEETGTSWVVNSVGCLVAFSPLILLRFSVLVNTELCGCPSVQREQVHPVTVPRCLLCPRLSQDPCGAFPEHYQMAVRALLCNHQLVFWPLWTCLH